jgi:uncharacterized membrane protein required for colicin V production
MLLSTVLVIVLLQRVLSKFGLELVDQVLGVLEGHL